MGPAQLRLLTMSYWGFDGQPHTGTMVVDSAVASAVLDVFARLFAGHFPIHRMQPEDAYGGQDPASMADDNTSGFNCRDAVAPGPPAWSVHAYGEAIDVNPVENPYLEGDQVQPPAGAQFLDRADYRPGMAVAGGQLVAAFASVGWLWGGRWTSSPDYQHFSATGGLALRVAVRRVIGREPGCNLTTSPLGSDALFGQDDRCGSRPVQARRFF